MGHFLDIPIIEKLTLLEKNFKDGIGISTVKMSIHM